MLNLKFRLILLLFLMIGCVHPVTKMEASTAEIWSIDWSPDGRFIAIGYDEGTISILDTLSDQQTRFQIPDGFITDLAWHPDSTRLAACSGPDLQIFNTSGNLLDSLDEPYRVQTISLSWSPDGTMLANTNQDFMGAGLAEYYVTVWDVTTSQILFKIDTDQTGVLMSVQWSPDGSKIAVASADTSIVILDTSTKLSLTTLVGHTNLVRSLSWSPDGSQIATAGQSPDNTVRIWDTKTGEALIDYQGSWITDVAWNPHFDQLAIADDNRVRIVDPTTMQIIQEFTSTATVYAVAWNPDGTQLVYGGQSGTAEIIEVNSTPFDEHR